MGGKKKVVVRVPCCEKARSIALETVAGVPGLSSVSREGAEKNLLVVIGEDIDPCCLIKSLKKKVGRCVELVTVGPVEEKKPPPPEPKKPLPPEPKKPLPPEPKKPLPPEPTKPIESVPCFCQTVPRLFPQEHAIYVCELCNPEPICVIM